MGHQKYTDEQVINILRNASPSIASPSVTGNISAPAMSSREPSRRLREEPEWLAVFPTRPRHW
jgi:hypothetical protein